MSRNTKNTKNGYRRGRRPGSAPDPCRPWASLEPAVAGDRDRPAGASDAAPTARATRRGLCPAPPRRRPSPGRPGLAKAQSSTTRSAPSKLRSRPGRPTPSPTPPLRPALHRRRRGTNPGVTRAPAVPAPAPAGLRPRRDTPAQRLPGAPPRSRAVVHSAWTGCVGDPWVGGAGVAHVARGWGRVTKTTLAWGPMTRPG